MGRLRMQRRGGGFKTLFVILMLFVVGFIGGARQAHALLILDDMVFIGPKGGAATFKIKNTTDLPKAYRIEWLQMMMQPGGGRKVVEPGEAIPGVMDAEPYMFMSPRRLMLQSGQLQHIRFMVRRLENLVPGEYRSYIVLSPEEIPTEYKGINTQQNQQARTASASLDILTGYRIPVFFLHGETTLSVSLTDLSLTQDKQGNPGFQFAFNRSGNRSAIGELALYCLGVSERPVLVTRTDIKIYTEIPGRRYFLPAQTSLNGCSSVVFDYTPHKLDPDYKGTALRMAEYKLN